MIPHKERPGRSNSPASPRRGAGGSARSERDRPAGSAGRGSQRGSAERKRGRSDTAQDQPLAETPAGRSPAGRTGPGSRPSRASLSHVPSARAPVAERRSAPSPDQRTPGVDLLAGRNSIREALLAGRRRVYRIVIAEGAREAGALAEIVTLGAERQIPVQRAPREDLDALTNGLAHQGVIAHAAPYPTVELTEVLAAAERSAQPPFVLVLDSLEDPQNVGALLRTAEAVGVHGVVVPRHRAVGVTPAVSRASAGAVEHLLVAEVTNLSRALEQLKQHGLWVVGVEDAAAAQDYRAPDLCMPLALVVGGEGGGMHRLVREECDILVRLPMKGRVGSLNVTAAGAVLLYRVLEMREAAGSAATAPPRRQ